MYARKSLEEWLYGGEVTQPFTEVKATQYGELVQNTTAPRKMGIMNIQESEKHRILDILRKPSLICADKVLNPDPSNCFLNVNPSLVGHASDNDFISGNTRLGFMTQFYRLWRGSVCFTAHFVTSPLVSAKVRICLVWQNPAGTTVDREVGDLIIKETSVRGTTTVSFEVPYLDFRPWQTTQQPQTAPELTTPFLVFYLSDDTVSLGTITPSVFLVLYCYAGNDFELAHMQSASLKRSEAQSSVNSFVGTEENIFNSSPNRVPSDKMDTMYYEDLFRRFDGQGNGLPGPPRPTVDGLPLEVQAKTSFDVAAGLFLFWRGGIHYKVPFESGTLPTGTNWIAVVMADTQPEGDFGMEDYDRIMSGSVRFDTQYCDVLEFEVPYYNQFDWSFIDFFVEGNSPVTIQFVGNYPMTQEETQFRFSIFTNVGESPVTLTFWRKAGCGFSLHYDLPPLPHSQWPRASPDPGQLKKKQKIGVPKIQPQPSKQNMPQKTHSMEERKIGYKSVT